MTATEELRRLLDERGVEWTEADNHTLWWGESTHHQASAYSSILFGESERVHLSAMVTPKQAIAATLGAGTCKLTLYEDTGITVCSECGAVQPDDWTVYYCWSCGRRIVEVDE